MGALANCRPAATDAVSSQPPEQQACSYPQHCIEHVLCLVDVGQLGGGSVQGESGEEIPLPAQRSPEIFHPPIVILPAFGPEHTLVGLRQLGVGLFMPLRNPEISVTCQLTVVGPETVASRTGEQLDVLRDVGIVEDLQFDAADGALRFLCGSPGGAEPALVDALHLSRLGLADAEQFILIEPDTTTVATLVQHQLRAIVTGGYYLVQMTIGVGALKPSSRSCFQSASWSSALAFFTM